MRPVKQAVILAGGLGTRLRPLTLETPKPMVRIHGKPFLAYIIELLKNQGITEIVILVGYLYEKIEDYFGDGKQFGVSITYSYSPVESETGTRLKQAYKLFDAHFLLLYGDNYWPLNLRELTRCYQKAKRKALVTVYANTDNATKNNMYVRPDNIVEIYDKSRQKKGLNGVDIGFFLLERSIFARIPKQNFSFERVILPRLIKQKQLAGFMTPHKYYGLSTLDRIPMLKKYFKPRKVIFLDRDGVINKRPPKAEYIKSWKEFVFLPKAKDALKMLQKKGYEMYIVSNQAGIARKIVTFKDVNAIHKALIKTLKNMGVQISGIYICPHGWDEECVCRKPKPGLFFKAANEHYLNLSTAICIGDDVRDIMAGKLATSKTIFVGPLPKEKFTQVQKPDFIYKSLYEAVKQL